MLRISKNALLDWLYPPFCILCDAPLRRGKSICCACEPALHWLPESRCLTCAQVFDGNLQPPSSCPNCHSLEPAFNFAHAVFRSSDESLQLIHQLKLLKRPEIGHDLAQRAAESFRRESRLAALPDPILVPVPLHPKRMRSRQFNQAEVIAEPLAELLDLDCRNVLKRVLPTPRQATLTRKERLSNLAGAFRLNTSPESLNGRNLILIDDVFTTGSTAHECARTLRKYASPRTVAVFSIVRA